MNEMSAYDQLREFLRQYQSGVTDQTYKQWQTGDSQPVQPAGFPATGGSPLGPQQLPGVFAASPGPTFNTPSFNRPALPAPAPAGNRFGIGRIAPQGNAPTGAMAFTGGAFNPGSFNGAGAFLNSGQGGFDKSAFGTQYGTPQWSPSEAPGFFGNAPMISQNDPSMTPAQSRGRQYRGNPSLRNLR